ncbi:MAG: DNA gyrase subunit A [Deltaproteobacteria bacterium]|nr:DNA gyrase subunit A [Deltaproteobacteria bacterium]
METGNPLNTQINIEAEMRKSYLDYAMSVIVGRALPDARDGLKPVHRRILYAMEDMGLQQNKAYKKSARVVGDVIGKYHPHGDSAVYDTIVRMAQDFSLRNPLVDGQGNFGSMDGDSPAAMRYTEVRMTRIASELLADLDKDTVDFVPNYDETMQEPAVLPARVPNLLLNGSSGIAVGMATNIPPHNLGELVDALIALIVNPKTSIDELIKIVPGPDFPTGGFINGRDGIVSAYKTGRGVIKIRARAFIEKKGKSERESIIISEIPYQVNKARLIEKIAELVQEKKLEGISDIRDESDREGVRVVIDLKKDEVSRVVLNNLYKLTQMQITFGCIFLSIVQGQPQILNIKQLLEHFIEFRKEVITRRTLFELQRAERRAHILEGLKIALDNLDAIIALIRKSASPAEAKEQLMARFKLSDVQAQAILDMRLQRLTALERDKILEEYAQLLKEIERLKRILANEQLVLDIIVQELREIKEKYSDARRTEIVAAAEDISIEDTIADEDMVITISSSGYIKRTPVSLFRTQTRGGKGKIGMTTKEEDFVEDLFISSTHAYMLIFTDKGKVYWLKTYEVPQAGAAARGKATVNLINVAPGENISAVLPVKSFEGTQYVVMATKNGVIKKTELEAYSRPRASGIAAITIDPDDALIGVEITDGDKDVFLGTRRGMAIRFNEKNVRPMGRTSRGVRGIALSKGDEVVGMEVLRGDSTLLTITERGYGKRSNAAEYRRQTRGGKGIITIKADERNGNVVGIKQVVEEDNLMIITSSGKIIRIGVHNISVIGRNTKGVRLISVDKDERVVGVTRLVERLKIENE